MPSITLPWQKFLLSAEYPIELIYTNLEGLQDSEIPPLLMALIHWEGLSSEVANGGLGQYYFNHAQIGGSFTGLDRDISKHPLLGGAAELMKEVLERYKQHSEALGLARESGEWPDEFFDKVSSDSDELERRILGERDRVSPLLSRQILQSPHDYWQLTMNGQDVPTDFTGKIELDPVDDEVWQGATLVFRNGYPHGPNSLRVANREDLVLISPDCSEVQIHRERTTDIKNFMLGRKYNRKHNDSGTLLEAGYHTLQHKRIGEQWQFFNSGNLKRFEIFSLDNEDRPLSYTEYYSDGKILCESQRVTESPDLKHMKTYWPNGRLNAVVVGGWSIDNWEFKEAYDENGNSLLDDSGSGELRYAACKSTGEASELRADIVNWSFTSEFWKKRNK
jgi:hypothetical protein